MYVQKEGSDCSSAKFIPGIFKAIIFVAIFLIPLTSSTEYLWSISFIIFLGSTILFLFSLQILKSKSIGFVKTFLNSALLLFLIYIFISSINLPPFILKLFSPVAYVLYSDNLAGYPHVFEIFPLKTLTLYAHNTLIGLAVILSFFSVFLFLINKLNVFVLRLRLAKAVVFCAFIIACMGIINMLIQNKKLFWFIDIISGTPCGPFVNTLHFASFMAICIPLTLGIWVGKIDFKINDCDFGKIKLFIYKVFILIKNSLIYLPPASLMIFALFKSLSRGAMLAFYFSMAIFVFLIGIKRETRQRAIIILFCLVFFVFLTFMADSFNIKSKILRFANIENKEVTFSYNITERLSTLKNMLETDSAKTRFSVWKDTLKMFFDFPVFGTGLNTFSVIFSKYKTIYGSGKMFFSHAENDYIETLSELGLLGFAFLILIAIIFLRNVFFNFKREDDPAKIGIIAGGIASIFALLFCALTDFSFHIPSITFIFIVVCFIVWPEEKARRVVKFGQPNYQKKKFMAIVLFLSLVYLSMFLLSIKLFAADIFFYKFSYSQGNFNSRINYLEKAVFFNSNNAEYRYALGKTYFDEATTLRDKYQAQSIKFLEQAKINFERAIISQPTNWKYHFFNGSAELTLLYLKVKGYSLEEAQKSFDRAIELNPNEYEMYSYLGNYYLAFEPDKAFRYYRKLIMLKPRYLNDVLNTIWKINNNPDFIREAIPDDSFLIVKYADFLKIKGMEAEKFYKEAADLSVK